MQVFTAGYLLYLAIHDNADKGWPHVDKIQAIETMCDNQNIRCERRTVGVRSADGDDKRAGKTTNSSVKQRAGKAAQREIVGYKL